MAWSIYISEQADEEIDEIWHWGYNHFGLQVANDYDALIKQALRDLKENPYRTGTLCAKGREDALYSYHLRHSNKRAQGDIKHPTHTVFYFTIQEKTIAIASIAREKMEKHITNINRSAKIQEVSEQLDND